MVETDWDFDMCYITSVLYLNCSTQVLGCSNQNLVWYLVRNNIPCLKSYQIGLNIQSLSFLVL